MTIFETQFVKKRGTIFIQSTLELCGVLLTNSGEYTCIVENEESSTRMAAQLTVTDNIGKNKVCSMNCLNLVIP